MFLRSWSISSKLLFGTVDYIIPFHLFGVCRVCGETPCFIPDRLQFVSFLFFVILSTGLSFLGYLQTPSPLFH